MTQLTVNISLDVPDGFIVVLKPRRDGGYNLRMQAEVARVEPSYAEASTWANAELTLPEPEPEPEPEPKAKAPKYGKRGPKQQQDAKYMKKSSAKALDIVNDLVQLGEPVTRENFAHLAGCTPAEAAAKLQNLWRYKHIKQVKRGQGRTAKGMPPSTNVYELA